MPKCQACRQNHWEYSWQPFGPDDNIASFSFFGQHYRGFPVIKVCESCMRVIEEGSTKLYFTYRTINYSVYQGKVVDETMLQREAETWYRVAIKAFSDVP